MTDSKADLDKKRIAIISNDHFWALEISHTLDQKFHIVGVKITTDSDENVKIILEIGQ